MKLMSLASKVLKTRKSKLITGISCLVVVLAAATAAAGSAAGLFAGKPGFVSNTLNKINPAVILNGSSYKDQSPSPTPGSSVGDSPSSDTQGQPKSSQTPKPDGSNTSGSSVCGHLILAP